MPDDPRPAILAALRRLPVPELAATVPPDTPNPAAVRAARAAILAEINRLTAALDRARGAFERAMVACDAAPAAAFAEADRGLAAATRTVARRDADLAAAWQRLAADNSRAAAAPPLLSGDAREIYISSAAQNYLNMMAARARVPATPRHFIYVGGKAARRDLDKAGELAAALADAVEGFSAEAVQAISRLPPGEGILHPWTLAPQFRALADRFKRADVARFPAFRKAKREPNHYVHAIASNAAADFATLTGTAPTIITPKQDRGLSAGTSGPFLDFVTELFAAMQVHASAASAARRTVAALATPPV
jgi:hypothetical protein